MKQAIIILGVACGMFAILSLLFGWVGQQSTVQDTLTIEKITNDDQTLFGIGRVLFTDKDMECLTISATIEPEIHFAWDDKKVTISENDMKTMSIDELRNLGTLMSIFGILPALSPELMWVCGQKLLPRFFGQPEVK